MQATWRLPDGTTITATIPQGQTLMEAARANGVPAILGDCGGNMSCATCHVVVDPEWIDRTGLAEGFEADMLDVTDAPRQPHSRLSCQISMTADLDGLVLYIPT
jgi:2Fe-2S ferredoxin